MVSKIFKVENAKLRRSFLLYLHLIALFAYPFLFGFYFGERKDLVKTTDMIAIFFEVLAFVSPLIISIVVCLVFDREKKAGEFKNWLAEPSSKRAMIQGQLLYYWFWYVVEIIGTSLFYYMILTMIFHVADFPFLKFIGTSFFFAFLGLTQYEIAQATAFKWHVGGTLIVGSFGTMVSLLSKTILLDNIWPAIPWAWQVRLLTFWEKGIDLNFQKIAAIEYAMPIIITLIVFLLLGRYFNNFQGEKD